MAKGITHAIIGTLIGIILGFGAYIVFKEIWWYAPLIGLFYSLLPDIDHKTSYMTWTLIFVSWLLLILSVFFGFNYEILCIILLTIVNLCNFKIGKFSLIHHRGPTHTLWFALGTPFLLLLIIGPNLYLLIVAFMAYWGHLILDKIPFKMSFRGEMS